ncbi:MAG TPA: DNA-processing protein DprA [Polyangiaceae bacterium]|nr:DNA-processing protein DprA [Polyangiaceae bacterium]
MTRDLRILSGRSLPTRLADLPEPPQTLYVRGELPREPSVAIVGTRHATIRGLGFAESLAHDLASAGVAVLSGGAEGIDTAAHLGALRSGSRTAVIAPASFDSPYPAENAPLFQRVVEGGGAYVSLVPDGSRTQQAMFFPRNACLVALAHVVVVVEAGFRSGALNAARWARELGRPLLVVPHAPWEEKGKGCLIELRRGAGLCEGPADVLRELDRLLLRPLPLDGSPVQPQLPFGVGLGPAADLERVRRAIAGGAQNVDQVSEATGLSAAVVQRQSLTLALSGVLAPDASGRLVLFEGAQPPDSSDS